MEIHAIQTMDFLAISQMDICVPQMI
jgi:hypothetical protein